MAGLRPEWTAVTSHLVNSGVTIPNDYNRAYPTLHLAWQAAEAHELQLNYSHRIHRPETEDLNPFPEYIDPFNLREGNPLLKPEDIHSLEAGYGFHRGETSLTATVYHRQLYHGFTTVTRDVGNNVLLTTRENLAESRSTGVEITADTELGKRLTLNFSSNTFFNTIDASNLGFSSSKSDVSWMAKLGGTLHLGKTTLVQFNTNYTSTRLTPQGSRRPSFVANAGLRHELGQKKTAVVLTVSDLFNSLKETTVLDTPALRERIVRRRSARIVYLGLVYNFGQAAKKTKDEQLKFDNSL
jgi:outer membrane receptor protein involved in Fe transport